MDELDAAVLAKIDQDSDFQATLADLSDEDKENAIGAKKKELLNQEFSSLKEKAEEGEKAKQIAKDQKIRAEKAEEALKGKTGKEEAVFTPKDTLALIDAKVSSEDYDEVVRVAKILDKPIAEALKDRTMLTILSERAEERKTANAAQTGKTQRGVTKTTGEDLLDRAEKTGEVPEDEEGMKKLFMARLARKSQKR